MENLEEPVETLEEPVETEKTVLQIPFGGQVCLGTGMYRSRQIDQMTAGALQIGWMEKPDEIGKWLDESVLSSGIPLVRLVFPKIDSIDALIKQLVLLEYTMAADAENYANNGSGSSNRASEKIAECIKQRVLKAYADAIDRFETVESQSEK